MSPGVRRLLPRRLFMEFRQARKAPSVDGLLVWLSAYLPTIIGDHSATDDDKKWIICTALRLLAAEDTL